MVSIETELINKLQICFAATISRSILRRSFLYACLNRLSAAP